MLTASEIVQEYLETEFPGQDVEVVDDLLTAVRMTILFCVHGETTDYKLEVSEDFLGHWRPLELATELKIRGIASVLREHPGRLILLNEYGWLAGE